MFVHIGGVSLNNTEKNVSTKNHSPAKSGDRAKVISCQWQKEEISQTWLWWSTLVPSHCQPASHTSLQTELLQTHRTHTTHKSLQITRSPVEVMYALNNHLHTKVYVEPYSGQVIFGKKRAKIESSSHYSSHINSYRFTDMGYNMLKYLSRSPIISIRQILMPKC